MSQTPIPPASGRRRRVTPLALIGGIGATLLLALSMTGALSAFTASIKNSINTVSLGSLVLQETLGGTTCTSTDGANNAATCATINKYGGQVLTPGGSTTVTVTLKNAGTLTPASFTLTPSAATQSGTSPTGTTATDFTSQVQLKVYAAATATGTPIFSGTLATFTTALTLTALAPNATQAYTFAVSLPAGLDNTYQGLTASQPLTWAFSS